MLVVVGRKELMSAEPKNCYLLIKRQNNKLAAKKEDAMCKKSFSCSVSAVLMVAAVMLFGGLKAMAEIVPPNCGGANASDLQLNANTGGPVQVGQVIEYQVVLINPQLTEGGQQNC